MEVDAVILASGSDLFDPIDQDEMAVAGGLAFPRPVVWAAALGRALPAALYDRLLAARGRKRVEKPHSSA